MSGKPSSGIPTPSSINNAIRESIRAAASKPVEKFAVQGRAIGKAVERMTRRDDTRDTYRREQ